MTVLHFPAKAPKRTFNLELCALLLVSAFMGWMSVIGLYDTIQSLIAFAENHL